MALMLLESRQEALGWLDTADDLAEDLLALVGKEPTSEGQHQFEKALEFLRAVGAHHEEIRFAAQAFDRFRKGQSISIDTAVSISDGIKQWRDELQRFVSATEINPDALAPRLRGLVTKFEGDFVSPEGERLSVAARTKVVKQVIYRNPGAYARQLFRLLVEKQNFRFTYETLLNDIASLRTARQILTIGGPQGHLKFCFPDPARVARKDYFDRAFGVEARVENRIVDPGDVEWQPAVMDFYRINGMTEPTILALRYGSARLKPMTTLRTFGVLKKFRDGARMLGIRSPSAEMDTKTMLIAHKIAIVNKGSEIELLYDPNPLRGPAHRPR